ncbi:hypothetical protein [Clostridiisalibacter paucivorans]|uniref:hypothetical protein n=1 Tax=Clostridiisalibacter paucivorans TaxID=408753 RepID=UPI00047AC161|nr:hypothetical protein [Clostridiisalibacter paucivorans]
MENTKLYERILDIGLIILLFVVIIADNIGITSYYQGIIVLITIVATSIFYPLVNYKNINKKIYIIGIVNIVVFIYTYINIFLTSNYNLNYSYYIFTISCIVLVIVFLNTKWNVNEVKWNSTKGKIHLLMDIVLSVVVFGLVLFPISWGLTGGFSNGNNVLKIHEYPTTLYFEHILKEDDNMKIEDEVIIKEFVDSINEGSFKPLTGIEAANYMKRRYTEPYYEMFSDFVYDGFYVFEVYSWHDIYVVKKTLSSIKGNIYYRCDIPEDVLTLIKKQAMGKMNL